MKKLDFFKQNIGKKASLGSPSPLGRWLDGQIEAAEEGWLKVSFEIREEFTNPAGTMHGGIYAAICDEVIGMCTFTLDRPEFFAAINLHTDFLKPAFKGETILCEAKVVRAGKNLVHAECSITNAEGKLLAKANSNLIKSTF